MTRTDSVDTTADRKHAEVAPPTYLRALAGLADAGTIRRRDT